MAGPGLRVLRPPLFDTPVTPVTTHGIYWRDEMNGPGSGEFSITLDDAAYSSIQINDVAVITVDGTDVAAILIEEVDERTLNANGGAQQTATYSGGLQGAFMEWAVVAPALGDQAKPIEEDAVFDWRSPRYNPADDSWADATEIMTVTTAKAGGPGGWPTQPMGQDFTDSTGAFMIWDASGDASEAPAGTDLFYEDVTITTPGRHGLEVLMDNQGFVSVDGVQVLEISQHDGYHRVSFKRIELTEGTHRLAFEVENLGGADNPGALAYNLFKTDQQDHPMPGEPVVAMSSSSTQVLAYPGPYPGMTVGEILLDLLTEAQDRGALDWITPTFDADEDSNGDPWDREVGVTTKTGTTTLVALLDELVASGRLAQWRIQPDCTTFDAFAPGYTRRPTSVAYPSGFELEPAPATDPTTGQVIELNRKIT